MSVVEKSGGRLDDAALDAIFRSARSYNGYSDQPVTDAELEAVWELMKWGPTSANQLPGRFVWVRTPEGKEKLAAACSAQNKPKVLKAPVTVIVAQDNDFHEELPWLFPHADAKSWFTGNAELRAASAFRNATLQGAYLIIAARALGLDTGPMSGFDTGEVDKAFFADQPAVKTNFICTLGHGDPATIFDRSPRPGFETFNRFA